MTRVNPLGRFMGEEGAASPGAEQPAMAAPKTPATRSLSQSLERMEMQIKGEAVVEIDPALIDEAPSFVRDRFDIESSVGELAEQMRDAGQLSPILVRESPSKPGRYEFAYGRRRARAAAFLGRKVRAIIRPLNDQEMVVAQGQENADRKDLTFIEKAKYAQGLLAKEGVSRALVCSALSIDNSNLGKMLAVAQAVPDEIARAIGSAPKAGRNQWASLAEAMQDPKLAEIARKEAEGEHFKKLPSDDRFGIVLAAMKPQARKAAGAAWIRTDGKKVARLERAKGQMVIKFDEDAQKEFSAFLDGLQSAFDAFKARGNS